MTKKIKLRRTSARKQKRTRSGGRSGARVSQPGIFQQALAFHRAGRLPQAEALYRQILLAEPDHPEVLQYMGLLAQQVGKSAIAVDLMSRAITLRPDYVEAHYNLGNALEALGKSDEAAASYRKAIALKPDYVEAHYNLGILLQEQGKPDEAVISFRRAIASKPDFAPAHNNLGIALQAQGKLAEAADSYRRLLALKPDYAAAYNNLGLVLQAQGKLDEAVASFRRALTLEPDYAAAYSNLGMVLKDQGKLDGAVDSFHQALVLDPDYAEVHYNLGIVHKTRGKPDEATASFRRAIALKPDYVEAHNNLGSVLKDQGKLEEAIASFRRALVLDPDCAEVHSNLLYCLYYLQSQPVASSLDEARRYGRLVAAKIRSPFSDWVCTAEPKRLCVGMVSGDFRNHPVGYFLENILPNIDTDRIKLIAYPTNRGEDELTARLRYRFVAWKPLAGLTDAAAARLIHNDGVHILLDLSGHTNHNRLPVFAWKPAPIQATWLGYCSTTGLAAMDYLIADPVSVPESHQAHFTEKVWYLPETRLCFSPPVIDKEPVLTPLPALRNGYITFGCFQNLAKINDQVMAAWGKILQALPQARLRLQDRLFGSPSVREQVQQRLARRGIAPERVTLAKAAPRMEYLAAHAHIDIILDTFPATGGTTTCEALWMGVPTVTLAGDRMLSRQGVALLACAGLEDWIGVDDKDYVEKAITHAVDLEKLARLRADLRRQVLASPLFDGPRFARNFEAALWGMWRCFSKVWNDGTSE